MTTQEYIDKAKDLQSEVTHNLERIQYFASTKDKITGAESYVRSLEEAVRRTKKHFFALKIKHVTAAIKEMFVGPHATEICKNVEQLGDIALTKDILGHTSEYISASERMEVLHRAAELQAIEEKRVLAEEEDETDE